MLKDLLRNGSVYLPFEKDRLVGQVRGECHTRLQANAHVVH